jgi:hypothetical protein
MILTALPAAGSCMMVPSMSEKMMGDMFAVIA